MKKIMTIVAFAVSAMLMTSCVNKKRNLHKELEEVIVKHSSLGGGNTLFGVIELLKKEVKKQSGIELEVVYDFLPRLSGYDFLLHDYYDVELSDVDVEYATGTLGVGDFRMPASEVIKYLCKASGTEFEIIEDKIHIRRANSEKSMEKPTGKLTELKVTVDMWEWTRSSDYTIFEYFNHLSDNVKNVHGFGLNFKIDKSLSGLRLSDFGVELATVAEKSNDDVSEESLSDDVDYNHVSFTYGNSYRQEVEAPIAYFIHWGCEAVGLQSKIEKDKIHIFMASDTKVVPGFAQKLQRSVIIRDLEKWYKQEGPTVKEFFDYLTHESEKQLGLKLNFVVGHSLMKLRQSDLEDEFYDDFAGEFDDDFDDDEWGRKPKWQLRVKDAIAWGCEAHLLYYRFDAERIVISAKQEF